MGPKALAAGKRSNTGSNSKGPPGPAKAHVLIAALSLPPGVPGEVKGEVVVCVDALHWKYRQPPSQVQLRICWWGAPEGADAVVPFHASRGAGAAFPITSGPRFLVRYLRDMGTLSVGVEECPSSRVIGTASLDTSQVDVSRPLEVSVPCLGANKQVLATADVSLRIRYSQLLSSFEMAEHLASADKALPLYPLASVPNSRQQPTAAEAAAVRAAAAAAAATTTVVTGAVPSTVRLADMAPAAAVSRHAPAGKTEQQQQQLQPLTAGSAEKQQGSLDPAESADPEQQQRSTAPCNTLAATASADGLIVAGAAGTAAGRQQEQQQQQLHGDPLLEVIRKAEQLKQSLDQAAKAGIMLGLRPCMQHQQPGAQLSPAVPLLQSQPQQRQQACSPLAGAWSPSLLGRARALPTAAFAGVAHPLLLGPAAPAPPPAAALPGPSGSRGYSHSLLTAGELLAALAPALPAGHSAAAPGDQLHDQHAGSLGRHSTREHRHRRNAALAVAAAGSSSDDECSSSTSTRTASSRGSGGSSRRRRRRSSSGSSSSGRSHHSSLLAELDGLEELEDLLLQELLSIRAPAAPARRKAAGKKASPHKGKAAPAQQHQQQDQQQHGDQQPGKQLTAAAGEHELLGAAVAAAAGQEQVHGQEGTEQQGQSLQKGTAAGASLHVDLVSLHGLPAVPPTLTAVVKCAGQQQTLDITALVQQLSTPQGQQQAGGAAAGGVISSCGQHSCSTTLAVPAGLLQPLLAGQRPCLVMELWAGEPAASQAKAAAAVAASSRLLGIVRVPLQVPSQQQQPQQQAHAAHMQYLTGGAYPVYDILQGQAVGTLELSLHLLNPAEPGETAAVEATATAVAGATARAAAPGDATAGAAASDASGAVAAEGLAATVGVVGVRHVIDVTLVSASGLPNAADLAAAQQPVPDKRFIKYSFPGDEPLFTQEVECISQPVVAAHARHTVLLQPGESVAECFAGEPGTPEELLFEVYDKWSDDSDSLAAAGSLPLQQVLSLCQASSSTAADDTPSTTTFLVPLYPEVTAAQPAARSVMLQVSVSYSCSPCWALEGPEDGLQAGGPEDSREPGPGRLQQQLPEGDPPQHQDQGQDQGQLEVEQQLPHGGRASDPTPADPRKTPLPPSGPGVNSSSQQYPPITHDHEAAGQPQDTHAGPLDRTAVRVGCEADVPGAVAPAAGAGSMTPAAAAADPVPPMAAELCVKVIRACGLQAAVKEAEGWLGNASGLLGRARQLGPHPYVTVALLPGSSTVPAVRTPFQAQTFCPQFHYQHVLSIRLDPSTLAALASSDACVELWHHCPRSQAVVAALSRGLSSSYAMAGQQQVFLGSATLPLQGLLTHPQGICRWVVLRSQLGAPVAAVQLEVCFTHIGGTPVDSSPAAMPPLLRHPEWLQLLPAAAASRLSGYAALPPPGFTGQWVRLSVHVEELLLSGGDDAALERPKIASYLATFRLPGSSCEHSTHTKACSSHAATSNLLARSWHVDWKFCSHAWAVADARLAAALLGYPLALAVHKQEPSRQGAAAQGQQGLLVKGRGQVAGGVKGAEGPALVPCGSAEVDLSPLLAKRPGSSAPGCRWLSGTYPVIHPLSKALGNTRLRLKVMLELEPQDKPSTAWLEAHPHAHWQPSGALAAMTTTAPAAAAAAQPSTAAAPAAAVETPSAAEHLPAATTGMAVAVPGDVVDMHQQQQQPAELVEASGDATCPAEAQTAEGKTGPPQQQQQQDSVSHAASAGLDASSCVAVVAGASCTGASSGNAELSTLQLPAVSSTSSGGRVPGAVRLRAEVAHVTAPAGAASPGATLDAGEAAGATSPVPAEPPNQLMLLPGAAATAVAESAHAGQQHSQQMQLGQALQVFDGRVKLCDVRVCVECALNLELPDLQQGWLPALYVRYEWPLGGAGVTTPLVTATRSPLAGCSQAVKWFHCLHLPLALQSGLEQQQLETQLVGAAASAAVGPSPAAVVFQVWCRPVPEAHAAELPPLYAGLSAVPAESDGLLGCAVLDLSALQLLGSVDGWYNITDMHQQLRGQMKISLTPLKPLDAPPRPLPHSPNGVQQVLPAWPDGVSTAPLSTPATTAMLHAGLAQLQQQLDQLQYPAHQQQQQQHHQVLLEPEWSESATTAMLQGSLEDSLAQLQHHLQHMEHQHPEGSSSVSGHHQRWSLGEFGGARAAGMDEVMLPGSSSMQESAGAVQELSDAAFMALAAESTAAAEAAAAAVEAVAGASGQPVPASDSLLEVLRSNLEELDKLSEALQERISRTELPDSPTGPKSCILKALDSMVPSADAPGNQQSAEQLTSTTAAAASADRVQSFRHVRTLSDDEEYLVAPAGITESEADTDELMGRVDWALAANSDEEHDVPPGPPGGHLLQQQQHPAATSSTAAATLRGSVLQQPLNTEDWMFDIGRSTNSTAAALAARASSTSAACAGSGSSSLRASSSQLPVHPGQMSPAEAEAAAAAAATRLAQVDAAAAAAAARNAAAAAAAATRGSRQVSGAEDPAGGSVAAAAARPGDMWDHLAQVEDEDEAAALQRQQRLRQQREQHLAAVLRQLPAAARPPQQEATSQQGPHSQQPPDSQQRLDAQQQQQQQLHDPRRLPDALESRLDALLAEFQVAASGAGALVGRGATGPLPQFGSYAQQAQAAAAFGRLEGGGGLHAAWRSDDGGDSDDSFGDCIPVERVAHVSRGEERAESQQGQEHSNRSRSRGDPDEGEVLPRVAFANSLPPVQDDFVIEYSDGPPRSWLEADRQQRAQQRVQQQQQPPPQQQQQAEAAAAPRVATSSQRLSGYGSRTAAPTTTSIAASSPPPAAVTVGARDSPPSGSQSGFVMSTVGRRPVGGSSAAPIDIMEEMFSFSRQPSSSSSSIQGSRSGSIRHPGM